MNTAQKIVFTFVVTIICGVSAPTAFAQMPSYMPGYDPNGSQSSQYVAPTPTTCSDEIATVCAIPPGCDTSSCTSGICPASCKLMAPREYINSCHAQKNSAIVLHSGSCTSTSMNSLYGTTTPIVPITPPAGASSAGSTGAGTTGTAGAAFGMGIGGGLPNGGIGAVSSGGTSGAASSAYTPAPWGTAGAASTASYAATSAQGGLCAVLNQGSFSQWNSTSVSALQDFLRTQGYFSLTATGYFGSITKRALTQFQLAKGIITNEADGGNLGPRTRSYILQNHCAIE